MAEKSEFCFDCVDITKCSNCSWCHNCSDCVNVYLSSDCRGCSDCFGCVGLRNKQHYWFNESLGKDEYEKRLKESRLSREFLEQAREKFSALRLRVPVKFFHGTQAENSSGDYIENTERARLAFNCRDNKDTAYMQDAWSETEDCRDCTEIIVGELSYEIQGVEIPHRTIVARSCFNTITDSCYCDMCFGVSDCFGCFGVKKGHYCILNKQYAKEEYLVLKEKIISHMKKTGEWGEYFPGSLSPFAYNESMAQEYFPLEKNEALKRGFSWYDRPEPAYDVTMTSKELPETIQEITDDILKQTIQCKTQESEEEKKRNPMCAKAFRLIQLELMLYRKLAIPIPDRCFVCRRKARFTLRNPRQLWWRRCSCDPSSHREYKNISDHFHGKTHCPNEFETSYAPDRPEIVYCEQCYNSEVI